MDGCGRERGHLRMGWWQDWTNCRVGTEEDIAMVLESTPGYMCSEERMEVALWNARALSDPICA